MARYLDLPSLKRPALLLPLLAGVPLLGERVDQLDLLLQRAVDHPVAGQLVFAFEVVQDNHHGKRLATAAGHVLDLHQIRVQPLFDDLFERIRREQHGVEMESIISSRVLRVVR